MKTVELTYYINVPEEMSLDEIRHMLIYQPHNKKLVGLKEHPYIDISKLE